MGGMTGALGLGIILTLQDRVSAGLASIQQKLLTFKGVTQDMVKSFDAGARQIIGGFMSMTAGKRIIGVIDDVFGTSVSVSRSFEMAMARVQAVSGASTETFNQLRDQALEMGRTTRFTAMDAAGAQENLIRTGRNAADTMTMLPSVLKLASAEGLTLTESADMVSSALRMFNMDASEATRVANVFAETSRSTAANSRLLYQALSYSGGTMGQTLGYNIEQTMAMLGVLHNAVQRGSRAGTGLNQVMTELVNPKKLDKLKPLGIQTHSEQGEILPAEMILAQLAQLKKKMPNRDFLAALSPILPVRAKNAGTALINALDDANNEYERLYGKLRATTDAAGQMQRIMDNTSQGAMYRLQSATEALRIALGDQLRGAYDWVIGKTADFKSWLAQLIRQFPTLTKFVAGLITGLLALIGTLLIVTGLMAVIAGSVKIWGAAKIAMGVFFTGLKASIFSSISMIYGMSTPILAIIGLVYGLKKAWDANLFGIRDVFDAISVGFGMAANANAEGLAELDAATYDRLSKNGSLDAALTMGQVFYRFREFWIGFTNGITRAFSELKKLLDNIASAFTPIIEGAKPLLALFDFDVTSQVESWRKLGERIGYCIGLLVIGAIAWKIFNVGYFVIQNLITAVSWLWGVMLANPITAVVVLFIAAIALLYIYWDDFANWINGLWNNIATVIEGVLEVILGVFRIILGVLTLDWDTFCKGLTNVFEGVGKIIEGTLQFIGGLLQPIIDSITWVLDKLEIFHGSDIAQQNLNPNVGEQNYQQYRDNLVSLGYVLDDNDRVMQLPVELAAMEMDDNFKRGIEVKLTELKLTPQAPEQPKVQAEKQITQAEPPRVQEMTVIKQLEPPQVREVQVTKQLEAPTVQPENNAYRQYRDRLLEQGYLLDKNDHVLQFPPDYGMDFDYNARQSIERELARLRGAVNPENVKVQGQTQAVAQPPRQPEAQAPQPPQPQTEAQTVQQSLQPPANSLQGGQSASTIIKHDQNAANLTGTAQAQAAAQNPVKVNVNNEIHTKIETSSSDVRINEDVIGNIVHRHMESHQLRQGIDYGGMSVSYGGVE